MQNQTTVSVTHYKQSGKYYTSFQYKSMFEAFETSKIISEIKRQKCFIPQTPFLLKAVNGDMKNEYLVQY